MLKCPDAAPNVLLVVSRALTTDSYIDDDDDAAAAAAAADADGNSLVEMRQLLEVCSEHKIHTAYMPKFSQLTDVTAFEGMHTVDLRGAKALVDVAPLHLCHTVNLSAGDNSDFAVAFRVLNVLEGIALPAVFNLIQGSLVPLLVGAACSKRSAIRYVSLLTSSYADVRSLDAMTSSLSGLQARDRRVYVEQRALSEPVRLRKSDRRV